MTAAVPAFSPSVVPTERLLTTGQVARACRVTTRTVLRWLHTGVLPSIRLENGHHRISRHAVRDLLHRQGQALPEPLAEAPLVLVVDPRSDARRRTADHFRALDPPPRVEVIPDAFALGSALARWSPSLVVFDPDTPGVSAVQVCRYLQSHTRLRATGLVLAAPHLARERRRDLFEAGVHMAVPYPVEPRHVAALSRRWLES